MNKLFQYSLFNLIFLLTFPLTMHAVKINLPENHAVNGGVTIIPIDLKEKPAASYLDKKIAIIPSFMSNQWLMIVGIPLDEKAPIQNIRVSQPQQGLVPFHVSEKYYRIQSLVIDNKRKVDPFAKDRPRIEAEEKEREQLFSVFSERNPFEEGFIAPSHGPISSQFGLRRIYNGKPRAPHTGLDIASPKNTPVIVINSGKVVSTKNYFFTGNTVIVDHGMGLFSLYAHLDKILVKPNQQIKQGDQVGLVGATGRATGPHLHWSMILNQTLVDPLLFVPSQAITNMKKRS
ncbi:peptidoglycan DD-metalloendopeptidase family protein [Legionella sp. W05-934-2]|uniref:peptidoglycan DD-metalloendopeptidase family protein n=1 Tax=Legionella sp. W05-934-2 TaxID=1198649 RepID=UPI003461AF04